jgi:hypothetical protein
MWKQHGDPDRKWLSSLRGRLFIWLTWRIIKPRRMEKGIFGHEQVPKSLVYALAWCAIADGENFWLELKTNEGRFSLKRWLVGRHIRPMVTSTVQLPQLLQAQIFISRINQGQMIM